MASNDMESLKEMLREPRNITRPVLRGETLQKPKHGEGRVCYWCDNDDWLTLLKIMTGNEDSTGYVLLALACQWCVDEVEGR